MKDIPQKAQVELFAYDEEKTKQIIDDAFFKAGISLQKTIPTSEQYNDLLPVAKGKMSQQYYSFLKEKYGWKWTKDNVFGGNLGEMNAYEIELNQDLDYIAEVNEEESEKTSMGKILDNNGLGERSFYGNNGLTHIFLMFAKGIIPEVTAEQLSVIHLELYGRIIPMEVCSKIVSQINEEKKKLILSAFKSETGDSVLVDNALRYLAAKAKEQGWSEEKIQMESQALRFVAKKLEKAAGVTLGRSWVHDDCKKSKDSSLRKTFNFISASLDRIITGTVRDIADIDVVSRTKVKF